MTAEKPNLLSPTEWAVLTAVHRSPTPVTTTSLKLTLRRPAPDPEVVAVVLERLGKRGLLRHIPPDAWTSGVADLQALLRTQVENFIEIYPSQVPNGLKVLRGVLDRV